MCKYVLSYAPHYHSILEIFSFKYNVRQVILSFSWVLIIGRNCQLLPTETFARMEEPLEPYSQNTVRLTN